MNLPYLSYREPFLSQLEPGIVSLGVPVLGEAVQLGTTNIDTKKRLAVTIGSPDIQVAREDGTHLQIEDVIRGPRAEQRVPVLVEPIDELLLSPSNEPDIWSVVATAGLRVYNTEALGVFVSLVGSFALQSQSRRRGQAETASAARLLKLLDE